MTKEHTHTTPGRLTEGQRARIEFARRDWTSARSEDLGRLDAARLILIVERMRGRLGDVLDVVDELTCPTPDQAPEHHS